VKPLTGLLMAASLIVAGQVGFAKSATPHVQQAPFGEADGTSVQIYTLTNKSGVEARIMTYGATLVSLKTPDRTGKLENIVLGFDSIDPYLAGVPYYGATIGRFGNRIANGHFTLAGKEYQLPQNDGPNSLHGGTKGFDKRIWSAVPFENKQGPGLKLTYVSADGEEGYPGKLTVRVSYQLRNDNSLAIDYWAKADKPTVINLTNHTYFNLSADFAHSIIDEIVTLNADKFTPVNSVLIPTGELRSVEGTPFDFRKPTEIGARINADEEQIRFAHGYDDNWVLNQPKRGAMVLAATVSDPVSGREVDTFTTEPGLQFYTGNFQNGKPAGAGSVFAYRTGLTLETQHFPDSPNQPAFPSTVLRPGKVFASHTVFAFKVVK